MQATHNAVQNVKVNKINKRKKKLKMHELSVPLKGFIDLFILILFIRSYVILKDIKSLGYQIKFLNY